MDYSGMLIFSHLNEFVASPITFYVHFIIVIGHLACAPFLSFTEQQKSLLIRNQTESQEIFQMR